MKDKKFFNKGFWPFTPDPAEPGLQEWAGRSDNAPIVITGNSRHELKRAQRLISALSLRVFAMDTGGRELIFVAKTGEIGIHDLTTALGGVIFPEQHSQPPTSEVSTVVGEFDHQTDNKDPEVESQDLEVEDSPVEDSGGCDGNAALLPYPVWVHIGGEDISRIAGWKIQAGPANLHDLPAFLASGCALTEPMKQHLYPLEERLNIAIFQAVIFMLFAAIPAALMQIETLFTGGMIALLCAIFLALFQPAFIKIKLPPLRIGVFAASVGLSTFLVALGLGREFLSCTFAGLGGLFIAAWLSIMFFNRCPSS